MHRTDDRARQLFIADTVAVEVAVFHLFGIKFFKITLFERGKRELSDAGDDVLVDVVFVFQACGCGNAQFAEVAIPIVDILTERHVCGGFHDRLLYGFLEGFQLFFNLALGFRQHIFRDRQILFIVTDHAPALPSAVFALTDQSLSVLSSAHGFSSFPRIFSSALPVTSEARFCISSVTCA